MSHIFSGNSVVHVNTIIFIIFTQEGKRWGICWGSLGSSLCLMSLNGEACSDLCGWNRLPHKWLPSVCLSSCLHSIYHHLLCHRFVWGLTSTLDSNTRKWRLCPSHALSPEQRLQVLNEQRGLRGSHCPHRSLWTCYSLWYWILCSGSHPFSAKSHTSARFIFIKLQT